MKLEPQVRFDQSRFGPPNGLVARPILDANDLQKHTFVREEDARSALARGLKDYLETLSITWGAGRLLRWDHVSIEWAEPEDPGNYPALSIVGEGEGTYEENAQELLSVVDETGALDGYLKQSSELKQTFNLIVWANDPAERSGLVAALEDALEPVDWMQGLRLELPYYFNARAGYAKLSVSYTDDAASAQSRARNASIMVTGYVTQYVPTILPPLRPVVRSTVLDAPEPVPGAPREPAPTGSIEAVHIIDRPPSG